MKVMCIDEDFRNYPLMINPKVHPTIPNIYNIVDLIECRCGYGSKGYVLDEFSKKEAWIINNFAIIDEIPEKATHSSMVEMTDIQ